jgi:heterodisulfide reductase subunit C
MPTRDTFGILPPGTEPLLYLLFIPFGVVLVVGLRRLFAIRELRGWAASVPGGAGNAAKRFFVDAFLQRRVAQRPRGWAHIAIVAGFLALLFGTTTVAVDWHYYHLFGVHVLAGERYLYFKAFLDVLGVAFIAGLFAALLWRLVKLRDASPDQRRIQRQYLWLLAGLLYMGCTGFLLEALRLRIHPVSWAGWSPAGAPLARVLGALGAGPAARPFYIALWWSHAVVAFSLIASIPYTVFMHAIAAPLNIVLQAGGPRKELSTPFDLRELEQTGNFEVKVGATTLSDLEAELRFALNACTNCGRCDDVCPAVAMGTALSPRRLVQALRETQLRGNATEDLLASGTVTPGELWACTTCAACVEACPVFIRPVDYIVPFRRELVARQQVDKRQTQFLTNVGLSANPYGLPAGRRSELAAQLETEPIDVAPV